VIYKSIFSFSPGWRDLGNLVNLIFPLRVFLFLPLRVIYKSIFFSRLARSWKSGKSSFSLRVFLFLPLRVIYKSIFSFSPGWRDLGNLVNLIFPLRGLLFSSAARDL